MAEGEKLFTKEEVSELIAERLARDRKNRGDAPLIAENTALKAEIDTLKTEIEGIKAESKKSEVSKLKARIAADTKLPLGLADRLQGEDETAIKADAERLAKEIGPAPKIGQGSNPPDAGPKTWTREEISKMTPEELIPHMAQIEKQLKEGSIK